MDNLYMKGELLQVHTTNRNIIEGRFFSFNKDKSQISLYEVKESEAKKNNGVFHYYGTEVTNIVKLQKPDDPTYLKITLKECEEIIKTSMKYILINQIDHTFNEAVDNLNQYNFICISTDGANMARKCKMPFLVLSTPTQIYIFDIQVLQHRAFDAGLKKLLESNHPKKIVHDCRKLSDCLYYKHNVKLNSVFDTQVGDLIITKNKTGQLPSTVKSLGECLNTYLGLKMNIIEDKLDIVKCNERPLLTQIKESLAKNICYMHRFSEIINDQMMLPFVRGVECYVENIRSCDDFKAWELCGKQDQSPKEFKSAIEY